MFLKVSDFEVQTTNCWAYCGMPSGIRFQRGWSIERNCGGGAAYGRERAARRQSKHCYRLGRWNGRRTGRLASTLL